MNIICIKLFIFINYSYSIMKSYFGKGFFYEVHKKTVIWMKKKIFYEQKEYWKKKSSHPPKKNKKK